MREGGRWKAGIANLTLTLLEVLRLLLLQVLLLQGLVLQGLVQVLVSQVLMLILVQLKQRVMPTDQERW